MTRPRVGGSSNGKCLREDSLVATEWTEKCKIKNRLPHCGFEDPFSCLCKRLRIWLAQGRASWPFQIEEKKLRPLLFLFQTCLDSPPVTISHPCDSYLMSEARNQPTLPFYWKVRFLKRKHVLSKRNVDRGERRCNHDLRNLVRTLQQKHVFAHRITWISPSSPKNHLPSGDRPPFHPRCGICYVLFSIEHKTCTNENIPQLCPRFRWLILANNKFEVIWNRRRMAQDVSHIPKCSMNQIRIDNLIHPAMTIRIYWPMLRIRFELWIPRNMNF